MKLIVIATTAALMLIPSSAFSAGNNYSAQSCAAWFKQNDRNNDGTLARSENASKFLSRVTLANDSDQDYIMSKAFFVAECKIGSLGKPPSTN